MDQQLVVVSECDTWHSNDSKVCVGVFDDWEGMMRQLTKKYALTKDDLVCIENSSQTQGRETNLIFDFMFLNKLSK